MSPGPSNSESVATTTAPPAVEIRGLSRRFGPVTALDNVSLRISPGEFFSLLGPSGCGKTTLLRLIAGLDAPDGGRLFIHGQDMAEVPAHRRPVNTVFQSYALFPHMNVRDNVGFGLRMAGTAPAEIASRVDRVTELVRIGDLARRMPNELSGGQRQRVALARAVVNEPKVLLLDEPLGALDLKLRKELQTELHQLHRRLGITFIHVTHDQDEALALSDRIAVMNHGIVEQLGGAADLYERPATRFVAQFLGSCNLLSGQVREGQLQSEIGDLRLEHDAKPGRGHLTVAVRPEKIVLSRQRPASSDNVFAVQIQDAEYRGSETQYVLLCNKVPLVAVQMNMPASCVWKPGDQAWCHLPGPALISLED